MLPDELSLFTTTTMSELPASDQKLESPTKSTSSEDASPASVAMFWRQSLPASTDEFWIAQQRKREWTSNPADPQQQLFSIGLFKLHQNGSKVQDANGDTVWTYTDENVMDFARIFTGLDEQLSRRNIEAIAHAPKGYPNFPHMAYLLLRLQALTVYLLDPTFFIAQCSNLYALSRFLNS